MKIIFCSLCLFASTAYSQVVSFKELRLKANPEFYNISDTTIIYPVVVTKNPKINGLINNKIRTDVIDENNEKRSLKADLIHMINTGLINLSYEITFKKNGILSLIIFMEGCGANCSSSYFYFNFDLKTGMSLRITDVFYENKLDSFKKLVSKDKVAFLEKYKEEEKDNLASKEIDSAEYDWIIEQVDSNCINSQQFENFIL